MVKVGNTDIKKGLLFEWVKVNSNGFESQRHNIDWTILFSYGLWTLLKGRNARVFGEEDWNLDPVKACLCQTAEIQAAQLSIQRRDNQTK